MVLDFKLLQNRTKRSIEITDETLQLIIKNNSINYYKSCSSHGANRKDMAFWVDLGYIDIETLETRVIIQRGITYENNVLYRLISQYPGSVPTIDSSGIVSVTQQDITDDTIEEKDNDALNNTEISVSGGKHKKKKSRKNKLNNIKLIFKSRKSQNRINNVFI
jgi:hypothetical protein